MGKTDIKGGCLFGTGGFYNDPAFPWDLEAVSYTHLDVYKRQEPDAQTEPQGYILQKGAWCGQQRAAVFSYVFFT